MTTAKCDSLILQIPASKVVPKETWEFLKRDSSLCSYFSIKCLGSTGADGRDLAKDQFPLKTSDPRLEKAFPSLMGEHPAFLGLSVHAANKALIEIHFQTSVTWL